MSDDFDYGEACPVSMAASVLAERWTLQIIREMFLGSTKYSQFQKYMPNISPTLLKNRLLSCARKRRPRGATTIT
jgi:DNA-binding HxlR family transcriptional regulator